VFVGKEQIIDGGKFIGLNCGVAMFECQPIELPVSALSIDSTIGKPFMPMTITCLKWLCKLIRSLST
jgi:hypothetical protein